MKLKDLKTKPLKCMDIDIQSANDKMAIRLDNTCEFVTIFVANIKKIMTQYLDKSSPGMSLKC